jgi:hypothetical protein
MKKLNAILLCAMLIVPALARADDAERKQLAEKLLLLTDIQRNTEKSFDMIKQMIAQQAQQAAARSGKAATGAQAAESNDMMDMVLKEFSWDKMKDDYIAIYAETFNEEELKGVIAFYESPTGKKFTEKQPELIQRSMMLSQKKMAEIMPKLQALQQTSRPKPGPAVPAPAK